MSDFEPVDTFDVASLEAFTSELLAHGFEPVAGTSLRMWRGRIHPAFAPLTDATIMHLVVRDGWPARSPVLFVEGLRTNHLTAGGFVCLWQDDDGSGRWTTVEGLNERIEAWCHDAQSGWDPRDLARDALLNFSPKLPVIATFDPAALSLGAPGTAGHFHAERRHAFQVMLKPGRAPTRQEPGGLWFCLRDVEVPPRNIDEARSLLNRHQARGLERALAKRRSREVLIPSGSVDLLLLAWEVEDRRLLLIMALEDKGPSTEGKALEPAPDDEATLILRAGPDAAGLRDRSVAVFGLGALGGHVALTLAESGVGQLLLVDGDQLHPGNAVRHVAGHDAVGEPKVEAVAKIISEHAPWTVITTSTSSSLKPSHLADAVSGIDLVVDATGNAAATLALSSTAERAVVPLVAGALYRGGAIARIQRQGCPGDLLIRLQDSSPSHVRIPPGDAGDVLDPTVGCSASVNNAPPASVTACAALISQAALDVLTGRLELADEVVDVYRTLPNEAPFDRLGRVERS